MSSLSADHHWNLPGPANPEVESLARETAVPNLLVRVLYRRGFADAASLTRFLKPSPANLHRPDSLPDIEQAASRIIRAIEARERILVHGDYDVDGVTGTALLLCALRNLGAEALFYLPSRETEGYGLSLKGVEYARSSDCRLILTTDCGVSDHNSIAAANAAGIDVVVTDHHEPPAELPPALAVVNPKRPDSRYPFAELAGCGVAFKLAWRLLQAAGRQRTDLIDLLDLVGLGTLADMVPLLDENRIIARLGLKNIALSRRPGIRALLEIAGLRDRDLTSRDIGFGLAPRINAAGRIGRADTALELLLTNDPAHARTLAQQLEHWNRSRQTIEDSILAEATELVEQGRLHEQRVMLVAGDGWHEGVIGIVASKLVDRFCRPSIVVSLKDEQGKGSGRSLSGFDLYAALNAASQHLTAFGGHRYAAGIRVRRDRIPLLAAALNEFAAALPESIFRPTLHIEAVAQLDELTPDFLAALEWLEPFGPDNPEPLFASLGVEVVGYPRPVGRDHLKFKVRHNGVVLDAIAWGRGSAVHALEVGRKNHLDICYTISRDDFSGRTKLLLEVADLRTTDN